MGTMPHPWLFTNHCQELLGNFPIKWSFGCFCSTPSQVEGQVVRGGTSLGVHFSEFHMACLLLVVSEISSQVKDFSPRPMGCGKDTVHLGLDRLLHSGLLCWIQGVGA